MATYFIRPARVVFLFLHHFAVFERFVVFNFVFFVVPNKAAVFLIVFKMADLPELAGLAPEGPFAVHDAFDPLTLGALGTVFVIYGAHVALLLVHPLSVLVRLFHGLSMT